LPYAGKATEKASVKSNNVSSSLENDIEASSESSPTAQVADPSKDRPRLTVLLLKPDIWKKIGLRLIRNPVLWAIFLAFALTLSTLGPTFLKPVSDDAVDGLGWIWGTLEWLGALVSPVSLIAMGVWMHHQERLLTISLSAAMTSMLTKLVLVPLIMVGLASAFDLEGNNGRAAVLIAALPISLASFTLASEYEIGFELLSTNVVLGTAFLLPTILVWNLVLDAFDLFPITKVGR
jgi:predicted permease